MKKRTIALMLALVLVIGCAIGGTIAWLTDETEEVKNVFATSDIGVELKESEDLNLEMVPGWDIKKDPKARITEGSEDAYLFVKVEESENFDSFMTYAIAEGWLTLKEGVYYKVFDSKDAENTNVKGTQYSILAGDKVTVLGTVTKEDMAAAETSKPTLTFTAYAHQLYKNNNETFTAAEAWALIEPTSAE